MAIEDPVDPASAPQSPIFKRFQRPIEWILFSLICAVILWISAHFDLIERLYAFSREHDNLQLDEIVVLLAVLCFGLGFDAFRRARALKAEVRRREASEAETIRLAMHDPVTGLPNRRTLLQRAGETMHAARKDGATLAMLFIDLDRFKPINDLLGLRAGDEVLQVASDRLTELVEDGDAVARIGGDEFIILARIHDSEEASRLARRVMEALATPILVLGHEVVVGCSVGVALFPGDASSCEQLIQRAGTAMGRARAAGLGNFQFFEPSMDAARRDRALLEAEMRAGLQRGEFVAHFQPLVNLRTGITKRYEALARWHHPSRGLVMPGVFIPVAEDAGLMSELSLAIMRSAFASAASWPPHIQIAVNLSVFEIRNHAFPELLMNLLAESKLEANRLELEVTEAAATEDLLLARETMEALQGEGITIALDDFGTGFSSLSNLRALPFDRVKIDRSFVTDLADNMNNAKVVSAIIGLSRSLGLAVTAEGIEDRIVADALLQLGCDEGQGWLYGKAIPAEKVLPDLFWGSATARPDSPSPSR